MRGIRLDSNRQYLMRRLAQEEAAATSAANSRARESHIEMARRYREACASPDDIVGPPDETKTI